MPWKCPHCAFPNKEDERADCESCGEVSARVVLKSKETNKTFSFGINADVGAKTLKSFAGKDSVFASSTQFRLFRDAGEGWVVEHVAEARNQTYLNGQPLPGPTVLKSGFELSVCGRMPLQVLIFRPSPPKT